MAAVLQHPFAFGGLQRQIPARTLGNSEKPVGFLARHLIRPAPDCKIAPFLQAQRFHARQSS